MKRSPHTPNTRFGLPALAILALSLCCRNAPAETPTHDVVIYGGTSAAITAAVQAKRMGQSVIVVSPDRHLGGLTSGGLGWTDTGNKAVIGGLAKEFYQAVYRHYQNDDAWKFQKRKQYGNRAQGHRASEDEEATMWVFEPHVAEGIFEAMVAENEIPVVRDAWLDRETGVNRDGGRITSIETLDGQVFRGRQFIDATYEGDLVAAAGVPTTFGREAIADFNEPHAGVQTGVYHHQHHFQVLDGPVDPYVVPGDPSSGVIPRVSTEPPGEFGSGDHRIQAYCFRTCFTNHDPNRVPFPKPEGYDPGQYEVLIRCFQAGWKDVFRKFDPLPNFKTDTNNHGPVSFDNIGFNYDYPEATYERRAEIIREHETYQKGLLYFICTDPRVPKPIQDEMRRWGLAKDEFKDNGNWPHQIYVREARRMIGQFIMTENHLRKLIPTPDSVGMGSYSIDSHNTQRYISLKGTVQNEGDIGISTHGPYEIAMGSLLPKADQCVNLTVPVCVSSTHMAFGSIRMEPVFMILGQSAATLSSLANQAGIDVQDVQYEVLKERLIRDGQILHTPANIRVHSGHRTSLAISNLPGITLDDQQAILTGTWAPSQSSDTFFGVGYRHNENDPKVQSIAEFTTTLPEAGDYEVRIAYPTNPNRCKETVVQIRHADGVETLKIDQTRRPKPDTPAGKKIGKNKTDATDADPTREAAEQYCVLLGRYRFDPAKPASVIISDGGPDEAEQLPGYVVIDAVNWRLATDH